MKVLVTGSTGFLGAAVCRALRARGDEVRGLSRTPSPMLSALGVEQFAGDIANLDAVIEASLGVDAIVHTAAKAGAWGRIEDFYSTNVAGTDNVLAACDMNDIRRLVYTSSPAVVHAGRDLEGVDESAPYPERYHAHYPATKSIAEKRVLAANGATLATVALRPHLIWGPGDNHLLPRLVARARAGRLRFVGDGQNRIDTIFIDNAVDAHLAALDRLDVGAACSGHAYFLTQNQPMPIMDVVNALLRTAAAPTETRCISRRTAHALGVVLEGAWRVFRLGGEPPMTRFIAEQLSTAHWFNLTAAKRDLGYKPRVNFAEGLARLTTWQLRGGVVAPRPSPGL